MAMIETERLRLRVFRPEDLNDYQAQIYGDAQVMRYLPGGVPRPLDKTKAVLDYFIEHQTQHGFSVWAVEEKVSGQFVGHCGLVYLADSPDVELAYAFGQTYWGQGYAPEAARASLRYGFEVAALPYILALAFPANLASQRVMQKIGMMYQGVTDQFHNAELVLYRAGQGDFQPGDSLFRVSA